MSDGATLFANPAFRYGMPIASSVLILAIAFFLIESQTVRLVMVVIAVLDVIVTPQVLKRAAQDA